MRRRQSMSAARAAVVSLFVSFCACACSPNSGGTDEARETPHETPRADAGASHDTAGTGGSSSTLPRPDAAIIPGSGGSKNADAGAGTPADASGPLGDAEVPPPCQPDPDACAGLCGPVIEPCRGTLLNCGGCATGLACDIDQHKCIEPLVTCKDLGAECGKIRNTCGARLDCGDCQDDSECDPNTNRCVACSNPTCAALGFECGPAWLGCGKRTSLADCGQCPAGFACNVDFNRCERSPRAAAGNCVPSEPSAACAAEKAECGFISDGCAGVVDCGSCPAGESCATAGIANRCGPPEPARECTAAGRECGSIKSACGGAAIDCGKCAAGDVCNANGKCGKPCTPALPAEAAAVPCGRFDDGCGGTITKACPDKGVCSAAQSCCTPKTCAADYSGMCGTSLADGCGGGLKCACTAGSVCSESQAGKTGTCCALPVRPSTTYCGTSSNACGSRTFACAAGSTCMNEQCCELPRCGSQCGIKLSNACGSVTCGCPGATAKCVGGTCCVPKTCTASFAKQCGQGLDDGCGGTIDCTCTGTGQVCGSPGTGVPGPCTCAPLTCAKDYAGRCGVFANGCGANLSCTCAALGRPAYETCSGGGTPGVCGCTAKPCGGRCGLVDDGCGGKQDCGAC